MFVRLSQNTFVRYFNNEAFITNQLTRYDRTYNETGIDFLSQITREPKKVEDIVYDLSLIYGDSVSYYELNNDFNRFVKELANYLFVTTGNTVKELDEHDISFSYSMDNPKTLVKDYSQITEECVKEYTQEHNLDCCHKNPHLLGIQFELTSKCNERCIHCYIPNEKKNTGMDMPKEKVFSIIDEFAKMGGLHVTLSGGEVFMHKDIISIVNYCREKDMQVSILSNLIAIKEHHIAELKKANISVLQTSLYSMNPVIHDTITTVPGSFLKTKMAIERLVASDIPIQISCPVMKVNYKDYSDVLNYARSLKCKAQTDYIMMAQSDLCTDNLANRLNLEETADLLKEIVNWDYDYKEDILKHRPKTEKTMVDYNKYINSPLCGAGINDCCITANGDVYPCAGWQSMVCGNVYHQSLKDIWEKSLEFEKIRKVTRKDFPECIECEARSFCAMCLVRNFNESGGDMFKINKHFCDVAFLNKQIVEKYITNNYMSNITDDYALKYEAIIKKAYKCNRYQVQEADADIYRHLLENYEKMMNCIDTGIGINDAKKQFDQQCLIVCGNIKRALEELNKTLPNIVIINQLLPQVTIHGINIVIDKIDQIIL